MTLALEGLALEVAGRRLWQGLTAAIAPGECWAVLGPNGAGKSSLLHAMAGLRPVSAGTIELDGAPLARLPRRELARRIGLLPQEEPTEFWGRVSEWVELGRYPHEGSDAATHARAALRRVGMEACADRAMQSLSGGEHQRVRLALVLAQAPDIYLLDEPMQYLDLRHQAQVGRLIRTLVADGATVILTLHEPGAALALASHALLLDGRGGIEVGPAATLLTAARLSALYDWPIAQMTLAGRTHFFSRTDLDYS